MTRQLFTAADIRRVAREHKSDLLVLGPADLITPAAADLARELGVRLVREPAPAAAPPLEQVVRRAVEAALGRAPRPDDAESFAGALRQSSALPPLRLVRGAGVKLDMFTEGQATPGTNVRLMDVITSEDGSPMAAGYMALDKGEFPWTLSYDEVDVVLEGELVITRGHEQVRGQPGDCLFIPKGSTITFGTPSHVRFVYVTFPADWNK